MDDKMTYVIDWELPQDAFRDSVRGLIHQAQKRNKVLALPIETHTGQTAIDLLTLLLAQMNCDNCDAPCCRANPAGMLTQLLPSEYQRLSAKYGKENFIVKEDVAYLPMPCPFLRKGPYPQLKQLCKIYPERPFVCILYPFQPGANDGEGHNILAVASSCPEGRRIARQILMMAWRFRRQYRLIGETDFLKGMMP